MARDPDEAATRIAAQQRGLITWGQARYRAGLTSRQIERRVAQKRWRRLQRRVFAVAGGTPSWQQSLLAAQRCARTERLVEGTKRQRLEELDDAVVTGTSALWLRGCRRLGRPEGHQLLVAARRTPAIPGVVVQRTRDLPASDVELVEGVPTLTVPRLCVELCGRIGQTDFTAVLDEVLGSGDQGLRREVHARALALHNGRGHVDHLVALTHPDAARHFRSWLERHASERFDQAGLPSAIWNPPLHDAAGDLVGIGDAVWPTQLVVVELDGLRFHTTLEQRRRDQRKDRRLLALGWLVLRYTWLDVVERPAEVVEEIRATLTQRVGRG